MKKETSKNYDPQPFQQGAVIGSVTIYLYYYGDYAMKYENLTRKEADMLLLKWNNPSAYPGWLAIEQ